MQAIFAKAIVRMARTGALENAAALSVIESILNIDCASGDLVDCIARSLPIDAGARVPLASGYDDIRVALALTVIADRHGEPDLSLRIVAKSVRLSASYLTRRLKVHTGHGFAFHLHKCRVRHAVALLRQPTLSVKEIAYAVGYRSTTQLDRHFRRALGRSPLDFRKTVGLDAAFDTAV